MKKLAFFCFLLANNFSYALSSTSWWSTTETTTDSWWDTTETTTDSWWDTTTSFDDTSSIYNEGTTRFHYRTNAARATTSTTTVLLAFGAYMLRPFFKIFR